MLKIVLFSSLAAASLTAFPATIYQLVSKPQEKENEKIKKFAEDLDQAISNAKSKLEQLEKSFIEAKKTLVKEKAGYQEKLSELKKHNNKIDYLSSKEKVWTKEDEKKENEKIKTEIEQIEKEIEKIIKDLVSKNNEIQKQTTDLYQKERDLNNWKNYLEQLNLRKIYSEKKT